MTKLLENKRLYKFSRSRFGCGIGFSCDEICEILFRNNYFMLNQDMDILSGSEFEKFISTVESQKYTNILFSNAIHGLLKQKSTPHTKTKLCL